MANKNNSNYNNNNGNSNNRVDPSHQPIFKNELPFPSPFLTSIIM